MCRRHSSISLSRRNSSMAQLCEIIKEDRHPVWLVDALILSAVAYSTNPQEELTNLDGEHFLPRTAKYQFLDEQELRKKGFESRRQAVLVVKSLAHGHMIIACRGTAGIVDALTDLKIMHRSMSLGVGSAHAGFLDRAKSIPLDYLRHLLIQGEKVVLTGHSLGGAVASLLALRLLEITPRWCHEQLQCYTFGCPFFADSTLARYINSRYKKHFVHIVSKNDIVPKVMPVAHTLYTLWAGLKAGPLEDLFNIARLGLLVAQAWPRVPRRRLGVATVATQTASWLPRLFRGLIHRLLALALSRHLGKGYAFAGKMVLLDAERSFEEEHYEATEDIEKHLALKLMQVSMNDMREHTLLSYIESVFSVHSNSRTGRDLDSDSDSDFALEIHRATVNVAVGNRPLKEDLFSLSEIEEQTTAPSFSRVKNVLMKKERPKVFKSKVACLVFARRMQEASPQRQRKRKRALSVAYENLGRLGRFAGKWNTLFLVSSAYYVVIHLRNFFSVK